MLVGDLVRVNPGTRVMRLSGWQVMACHGPEAGLIALFENAGVDVGLVIGSHVCKGMKYLLVLSGERFAWVPQADLVEVKE